MPKRCTQIPEDLLRVAESRRFTRHVKGDQMSRIALVFVASLCSGCFTAQYGVGKAPPERPSIDGVKFVVQTPADGADARPRTYEGSGRQLADAMVAALTKRGAVAESSGSAVSAKPYAFYTNSVTRSAAGTYRVTPTIELWSDRVTEWSGVPDEVKIRVVVTDAAGKTIDDRVVTAKSKWWTFGGDHPQEMLVDLFGKWATTVFASAPQK